MSLIVVVAIGVIAAPAVTEELTPHAYGFAGEGIGYISCSRTEEACFASSPFSLAIFAIGNRQLTDELSKVESDWSLTRDVAAFSLCDVHNSSCIHGPWGTFANGFECWLISPSKNERRAGGGATLYAGKWFSKSWWIFKVIDRGIGGIDEVGMRKSPRYGVHPRSDDGACGARDLPTSPLISGDFTAYDLHEVRT